MCVKNNSGKRRVKNISVKNGLPVVPTPFPAFISFIIIF